MTLLFAILFVVVGSIILMIICHVIIVMSSYFTNHLFRASFTRIWLISSVNLVSRKKLLFGNFEKKELFENVKKSFSCNYISVFDTFVENKWWKELE